MKIKFVLVTLLIAALAAGTAWFVARHWPAHSAGDSVKPSGGRKILYYQSSMHPWIKSDQPGNCTICGMKLVPVYEGEKGFEAVEGLVTLSSNTVSVINVQTEEVKRRPLQRTLRVAGTIDDNDARHRRLSAYVEGRIEKLFVNFIGAEVVEGQPLAVIYSPTLYAAEREYAALLKPTADAPALRAERQRLIAAAAQRLLRLGLAQSQIDALSKKAEDDYRSEILAPMSGTVVLREIYEGQYVKEGDKLFEIADFSTMWFLFDAYERDLAWIKPGQSVEVTTPAVPGKVLSAPVKFIDPNVKDMSRSAKVRVEIQNPLVEEDGRKRRELYHKLYAEGVVKVDVPEVLALPRSAVLSPGAQPVVYVDKGGGAYEQRKVKLGRAGDDLLEVLDGLSEGERIVTSGNMLIDAQAQLNQSGQPAGPDQGAPTQETKSAPMPPLNEAQTAAAKDFFAVADSVAVALAADNLAAFNGAAVKLHTAVPALQAAFAEAESWKPRVQAIASSGHLPEAASLEAARKAFVPFTKAVVEFVKPLRAQPAFTGIKIYQCPMVNQAVPGTPKIGQWLQAQAPLRNPFFGAEMIDCGSEVK